jgi:hypothetical protein
MPLIFQIENFTGNHFLRVIAMSYLTKVQIREFSGSPSSLLWQTWIWGESWHWPESKWQGKVLELALVLNEILVSDATVTQEPDDADPSELPITHFGLWEAWDFHPCIELVTPFVVDIALLLSVEYITKLNLHQMEIIYGNQQKKNHVIQKWNYLPHHGTIAINSPTNYTTAFDFEETGNWEIHNFPIQQLKTISI